MRLVDLRHWPTLVEARRIPIEHKGRWGEHEETVVIQDPDPVTLPTMVARSPQQQLRGIATDRCYVWPAYEATHLAVRTVLDLQQYGDFWIIREGHEPFSRDWSTHGDDPTRDGLLLLLGRAAEDRRGIRRLLRWFQQSSKGSSPRSGPSGSQ